MRGERPGILGPTRWTDLTKPTIAAVNGVAYAGGLEWACWTDLCIADEHATFGVTCRRWNIGLGDGGTQRLPRIVGFRVAMELIVTGRVIDAHEAQRIGLVNEVVPRGTCRERARELAHAIAALPQPAIRTDKEAAVRGFGRPLDEGLRIEAECFDRLLDGPEMAEGLRRFNERDHPDRAARRRARDAGPGASAQRRLTAPPRRGRDCAHAPDRLRQRRASAPSSAAAPCRRGAADQRRSRPGRPRRDAGRQGPRLARDRVLQATRPDLAEVRSERRCGSASRACGSAGASGSSGAPTAPTSAPGPGGWSRGCAARTATTARRCSCAAAVAIRIRP